ncbi:SDR family oxidoreductase [Celerinatantimonas diazotrophica]|uniref:Nucleoside-diphosphate-sugar epimerase n=1 Tax=Celerinatantimonas diazotrophica TaxID=412034 RepID=A0A4R1J9W9_9GAMM|nr:SDR family oxidoreductase [Celerinatantimonas diazotrophica]TCK47237.1 nucleoside-diphosphate-sugar epimerase [Celerinatantimonas diazotrophica]CAG9296009.1 Protein YeeZ [Celerinatantimonas diazotrophica]
MTKHIQQIAIVGCGWLGTPLAFHLKGLGFDVRGSRQHVSARLDLTQVNIANTALSLTPELVCDDAPLLFDGTDLLIINIPPRRKSHDSHYHIAQINALKQAAIDYHIPRILFVSSTSVYGPDQGLVDESTPLKPVTESGKTLVAIEHDLQTSPLHCCILRFGGLIGAGRHPGRFLSGRKVDGADAPVNLIHQKDCIAIIQAVIERDLFDGSYNAVCDAHPCKQTFYEAAAKALSLELPIFSQMSTGNKLISNQALKQALDYSFIYPDPIRWVSEQEI